ncbi:MAG: hypothetical protein ACD_80C00131G0006 [uncultured bacterium (gcode 4)]|uniref:Uncharacterized protein n=1 Tax=uncultured bacterium (gcode 4) TaxID=1234023 RepID=K1XX83_9BACT|nr:MAG: hypothetical protein ACD_80C00131G0006 [uncultured bacterium (gcode 4)]
MLIVLIKHILIVKIIKKFYYISLYYVTYITNYSWVIRGK